MECEISINNVKVNFNSIKALDGVTACVKKGEILGLIGPNGSGKTTLLRCISRTISPTEGEILVRGKPVQEFSNQAFAKAVSAMLPTWPNGFNMKSYEIVLMGCRNSMMGLWWEGSKEVDVVNEALRLMNATELYDRDFDTLSSGEQRKVLIAKSLAQNTDIILLDEPVAYLDLKHKLEVMSVLRTLADDGKTVIVSLHELDLASKYCEKVVVLSRGKVVAEGKPRDVITAALLKDVYGVDARVKWDEEFDYPLIVPKTSARAKEERALAYTK